MAGTRRKYVTKNKMETAAQYIDEVLNCEDALAHFDITQIGALVEAKKLLRERAELFAHYHVQ